MESPSEQGSPGLPPRTALETGREAGQEKRGQSRVGDHHHTSKKGPVLRVDSRLVNGEGPSRGTPRGAVTHQELGPGSAGIRRPGRGPPDGTPHSSPAQVTAR